VRRTYALPIGLIDFALYELILHFADELKKYFAKGTRRAAALH
jgi:hypothetical protein